MIRVAVIVGKMDSGGKKNLIMEYYRHINRTEVQFDFICDSDSLAIPKEEIKKLGGCVFIIPPYQKIFSNMFAMLKIFKENKYPILHGYNSTMNLFAMFVGKLAGIPVRINESISMGHKADKKNIIKNILKPFSTWFATHYMANGEICGRWQFGDKLVDQGKVKVFKTVIDAEKNKFDLSLREQCRKEYNLEDRIVIGHIGRFTAQKNTLFIIDVFNEIVKKEKKAKLLLIGDGELKDAAFERVKQYEIEENVLYLGRREDIQQFYNAMDCFMLPSLYEGLSVAGVEAECCGLPVFFSTEVPLESSACDDLGFFYDLNMSVIEWADKILTETKNAMVVRKDRSQEVKDMGFDSYSNGKKLTKYYLQVIDF